MNRFYVTWIPLALLCLFAVTSGGAERKVQELKVYGEYDAMGFLKPVPVNVSGFSGEADSVLKFDLLFMGVQHVSMDEARFLITGSNGSRVEGHVTDKATKKHLFGKAYAGVSTRAQVHAFADDVAMLLTQTKGIAQTKIAFKVETGRAQSEVYLADYDGHGAQSVTRDGSIVAGPCWLPGRAGLLYASYKLGNPHIFSHVLSTGARAAVARHPGGNYSPAISPDGTRVAMILSKSGSPDLYVANIDGSGLKQLTSTREAESCPCWSPDGRTICYSSRERGATLLYTILASGGSARHLPTTGAPSPTEPDWSPDGKWIAFTSQASTFQICFVRAEGGPAYPLVEGEDPSWAPNSRALMFCAGPDHSKHLSLLDVPTKQVKHVARISESNSQPSWAK
jgi:TolB protein